MSPFSVTLLLSDTFVRKGGWLMRNALLEYEGGRVVDVVMEEKAPDARGRIFFQDHYSGEKETRPTRFPETSVVGAPTEIVPRL